MKNTPLPREKKEVEEKERMSLEILSGEAMLWRWW